jgi:hypothetical protein
MILSKKKGLSVGSTQTLKLNPIRKELIRMIITQKNKKVNTLLKITFKSDISEEFGQILPFPHKHYINNANTYYWLLNGYFGTNKSIEYINDIKARFLLSYKDKIVNIDYFNNNDEKLINPLELKSFQKLKSLAIKQINLSNRFDGTNDFVFWCLKIEAEEMILKYGLVQYDNLLDWGYLHFKDKIGAKALKDYSTLRAKCKSIVNYYIERDYKLDRYIRKCTNEELKMSRSENMKKQMEKIKDNNYKKVKHFLSGMFIEEYKKPNGKWNYSKIGTSLKLSRKTIKKHIEEIERDENGKV